MMQLTTMLRAGLKGLLPAAGLVTAMLVTPAAAQTDPTATDIIRSLAPKAPSSIGRSKKSKPVPVYTDRDEETTVTIDYDYTTDLEVYFRYDSSRLTKRARHQLGALGEALNSPELRPYRYLIAGHTDAAGDAEYNERLSLDRAFAVRDFLVEVYGIHPRRLIVAGFGERQLKRRSDPYSGINRRVEIAIVAGDGPSASASSYTGDEEYGSDEEIGACPAKMIDPRTIDPTTKLDDFGVARTLRHCRDKTGRVIINWE